MMFYIFQVLIAMVSPFLLFLYIPIYKSQRHLGIVLAAFLTAMFMFFKPLEGFDLLVHYQNFTDYQTGSYELFSRYFGIDILIYIVSKIGLAKNALVVLTSFFLFFSTYVFVAYRVPSKKLILTFLLIVASYPLVLLISGVRYSLALSFFLLSDVFYSKKNKLGFILSSAIAISFHYAVSVLVVLYLLSKLLKLDRLNLKLISLIFISIIPIVFFQSLLIEMISLTLRVVGFEKYVGLDLSRYVSGEWGAMRSASYNINGLLGYYFPKISLCLIGFYYIFKVKEKNSFVILLFGIVLVLFNFGDIGDRFSISLIPFLLTSLMCSTTSISIKTFPVPLLFIFSFCLLNLSKEFLLYGQVYIDLIQSMFQLDSPLYYLIGGK